MSDVFEKPPKRFYPMEGVEVWKNPKNKFCVVELHWKADPDKKNDPEWIKNVRASMPHRDFMREYELSWESWAGLPVFPDWDTKVHGSMEPLHPHLGLPLLRGWDFGLTPAAIVCQLQEDRLMVIREFVAFNMGLERFSELVLQQCSVLFPTWADRKRDWIDFIDPSGEARKDTDEGSCAKVLDAQGLRVNHGAISFTERRKSVEYFLTKRSKSGFAMCVDLAGCPTLVRGFKGGYQYPENVGEIEPNSLKPLKNKFSHIHDALQMVTSKLKPTKRRRNRQAPPTPSYGFTRDRVDEQQERE